jgi:hypothetical protein
MGGRESIHGWVITGYVFAALYALIGAAGFTYDHFLGGVALVCAALYGLGSLIANAGGYRTAQVVLTIGGIPTLPLGIVMIIAGAKIGKWAPRRPVARSTSGGRDRRTRRFYRLRATGVRGGPARGPE